MAFNNKDKKIRIYDESGNLSKAALLGFVYDELSPADKAEVAQIIANDSFYLDAVEGLRAVKNKSKTEKIISDLNIKIGRKSGAAIVSNRQVDSNQYLRIAAVIIGLGLVGVVATLLLRNIGADNQKIAQQQQEVQKEEEFEIKADKKLESLSDDLEAELNLEVEDEEIVVNEEIAEIVINNIVEEEPPINNSTTNQEPQKQIVNGNSNVKLKKEKSLATGSSKIEKDFKLSETILLKDENNVTMSDSVPSIITTGSGVYQADEESVVEIKGVRSSETENYIDGVKVTNSKAKKAELHEDEVFSIAETSPEFLGGQAAMLQFIKSNINYPQHAKESKIEGKVYVSFTVDVIGSVTNVRIVKGINKELNKEAKRVINSMPKWKPGTQRGLPVSANMNVPIEFSLED